ncbi:class I SAM-dependent methyltransferase [Breoghania sp.]|uniref:class I SAM-dependent DNA methyltransferase n=1 Tax=Breoghania sp. TaxID=2065378 RepID=UPI00260991C7|nr:class I SAM-dependent methyltransferase [Breoghania sp.]MDJ0930958.1 class I SAM-dependent methyltransferase [Breoghania sp.]
MAAKNPLLRRVYAFEGDKDDISNVYSDWAKSYEEDTLSGMGYVAPALAAEALTRNVGDDARVLDAGCGTDLVGLEISRRCKATVDGRDLSQAMLDEAKAKEVYDDLQTADLTKPLDIEDDSYEGVICVGVFTSGHVGPKALDELSRVAKPGAPVIVTMHENGWTSDGYFEHLKGMERRGLVTIRGISESAYHEKEGMTCRLCVLEAA